MTKFIFIIESKLAKPLKLPGIRKYCSAETNIISLRRKKLTCENVASYRLLEFTVIALKHK